MPNLFSRIQELEKQKKAKELAKEVEKEEAAKKAVQDKSSDAPKAQPKSPITAPKSKAMKSQDVANVEEKRAPIAPREKKI